MKPNTEAFFDRETGTVTCIIFDEPGGACAILDPVLDYDPKSGRTDTSYADKLVAFIQSQQLKVEWILETHAHADHLTSAHYLKSKLGGKTAIGKEIPKMQEIFKKMFNLEPEFVPDGRHFDHLFDDAENFKIGKLSAKAISTPGHTPADLAYQLGDTIFVGDTLFMPDLGTARADFPGGDARRLFRSIRKLLEFPPQTRLFMCHDYPPPNRQACWEASVAEQRASNIHVHDGISEDEFVAMREARDATLDMPALLLPAVQVNVRAGQVPPPEQNGVSYLKIPLNTFDKPSNQGSWRCVSNNAKTMAKTQAATEVILGPNRPLNCVCARENEGRLAGLNYTRAANRPEVPRRVLPKLNPGMTLFCRPGTSGKIRTASMLQQAMTTSPIAAPSPALPPVRRTPHHAKPVS